MEWVRLMIVALIWPALDARLAPSLINTTLSFMHGNGLKFVTITSRNKELLKENVYQIGKLATGHETYIRGDFRFDQDKIEMFLDCFLILASTEELESAQTVSEYLTFLSKTRRQRSVLVVVGSGALNPKTLLDSADNLNENLMFYLFQALQLPEVVIKIKNTEKTIRNRLDLDSNLLIKERYDLQGLLIMNIGLTWLPDIGVYDCDSNSRNCKTYEGILPAVADAAAKELNFTWDTQVVDNWGSTPISGPYNLSGEWGGALGNVVLGNYPMCLAHWVLTAPRWDLLEFVISATETGVLAVTPRLPEVDLGLFIRPFRREAWFAALGVLAGVILLVTIPFWWNSTYDSSESFMITKTSGWCFFMLINAFYGGALTMFFTTQVDLPFETMRDVMQAYPSRLCPP